MIFGFLIIFIVISLPIWKSYLFHQATIALKFHTFSFKNSFAVCALGIASLLVVNLSFGTLQINENIHEAFSILTILAVEFFAANYFFKMPKIRILAAVSLTNILSILLISIFFSIPKVVDNDKRQIFLLDLFDKSPQFVHVSSKALNGFQVQKILWTGSTQNYLARYERPIGLSSNEEKIVLANIANSTFYELYCDGYFPRVYQDTLYLFKSSSNYMSQGWIKISRNNITGWRKFFTSEALGSVSSFRGNLDVDSSLFINSYNSLLKYESNTMVKVGKLNKIDDIFSFTEPDTGLYYISRPGLGWRYKIYLPQIGR